MKSTSFNLTLESEVQVIGTTNNNVTIQKNLIRILIYTSIHFLCADHVYKSYITSPIITISIVFYQDHQ